MATPSPVVSSPAFGHDPRVLNAFTDWLVVWALRHAQGKVIVSAPGVEYREVVLAEDTQPLVGTRCYMNLEATVPSLTKRLRPEGFGSDVVDRVNLYISPAGCGTPLHFDIRDVCIVQLFGTKTWFVADTSAVDNPSRNCIFPAGAQSVEYDGLTLNAPEQLHAFVLVPGDWLVVGKGVWHKTHTARGSVSATLAVPMRV